MITKLAKPRNEPIIKSLMDEDFYKLTMDQVVREFHPDVRVKYGLTNRTTSVALADAVNIKELRAELAEVQRLSFNNSELHYLRGTNEYAERMFSEDFLEYLQGLQLPPIDAVAHFDNRSQLRVETEGIWSSTIHWETIALSIINQLYYEGQMRRLSRFEREVVYANGQTKLLEKIKLLREYPEITFSDFGTRRRFSADWQDYVVGVLAEELPRQFIGTSNTKLAMKYGLMPIGTSAHEMPMVYAGIYGETDDGLLKSHNRVLQDWWTTYGYGLSIALTDTFGTDFFFRDMTSAQAADWKGLRQDSANPIEFGEKAICFYQKQGINPKEKLIVFSDGLDVFQMIKIYEHFRGRIKVTFGWGTNLTNDLGFKALSLVIKAVMANGRHLVKLSDNIQKAIGDEGEKRRYINVFGYDLGQAVSEECRY